jgi:hypothetical protein
MKFIYTNEVDSLYIVNLGNYPLELTAIIDDPFVTLSHDLEIINAKDTLYVGVEIDRSNLSSGVHSSEITFTADGEEFTTLLVKTYNFSESNGNKFFDFRIADAEFSRELNKIIAISNDPINRLYIIDPLSENEEYVDLSYESRCVSVSPNGLSAVVGHDYNVSYLNLQSPCLESTYQISERAGDIVLDGNGSFHVFPTQAQWTNVLSVQLTTGNEHTSASTIYSGCRAKLHP